MSLFDRLIWMRFWEGLKITNEITKKMDDIFGSCPRHDLRVVFNIRQLPSSYSKSYSLHVNVTKPGLKVFRENCTSMRSMYIPCTQSGEALSTQDHTAGINW